MKIWDLSIKKPVTVFMGLICILVMGVVSFKQLKLAFLPQVDIPRMMVQVSYPNQSPDLLEREVTRPLEESLSTLKGVEKISSETNADQASIFLEFGWGKELDLIRLELGLKVEEIRPHLPKGIQQIAIYSFNTNDIPVLEARISAQGIDLSENYDLLDKHIKQKLERVAGVARVELGGILPKEVSIELALDKIREHHIDVGAVIESLSRDNVSLSAGKIKADGLVYNIRGLGKIESLGAFEELAVNDQGLRLKDIAEIVYEEPPVGFRRHLNGNRALALTIYKESTANTVETAENVRKVIDEEISTDPLLKGINLFVWDDQAREITSGLDGLKTAGMYGALFAIIVLFIFLRSIGATLVVGAAIPISILGSFIFLYAFGYTLNVLTMMGLMLAVGMLVDNAVVVLESIYTYKLQGLSAREATSRGTREVMVALVAATASTMIVFLSLVISDGTDLSIWLGAIGMTISITLGTSLLVSTTIIPLFASRMLSRMKPKTEDNRLVKLYSRILDWSMRHRGITIAALVLLVISMFFPASQLSRFKGTSYQNNRIALAYEFHDFFFVSDTENAVNQVEAWIEPHREEWGIRSVYSWITENEATTIILLEDENIGYHEAKAIRTAMREGLPPVAGISFFFDDDEKSETQGLSVQLYGTETEVLKQVANELAPSFEKVEGLYDVRPGTRSHKKELQVTVDREQANLYGINPETIADVFGFTLRGTYLPRFRYGDRERDVQLGLRIEDRTNIEDVSAIPLAEGVTLGSIAHFEFKDRADAIRRVDRKAHHAIRATYEGSSFDEAKTQVEGIMNSYNMPPGVSWSWSDRMIQKDEDMSSMLVNMLMALLLVYLVMASLFESLTQPFLILFSTITFSMVGMFWFLFVTKTEMDIMAMIGGMILIGIVVNNGIILMDRYNQLRSDGMGVEEAAIAAAHQRIRPILMTASTTIIGLVPMAIGNSGITGAYYFPLARCVIGGLTSSTLLTLVGLPCIMITNHRIKLFVLNIRPRFRQWRADRRQKNVASEPSPA